METCPAADPGSGRARRDRFPATRRRALMARRVTSRTPTGSVTWSMTHIPPLRSVMTRDPTRSRRSREDWRACTWSTRCSTTWLPVVGGAALEQHPGVGDDRRVLLHHKSRRASQSPGSATRARSTYAREAGTLPQRSTVATTMPMAAAEAIRGLTRRRQCGWTSRRTSRAPIREQPGRDRHRFTVTGSLGRSGAESPRPGPTRHAVGRGMAACGL